jgi:polysaccharide export outer membrane protein
MLALRHDEHARLRSRLPLLLALMAALVILVGCGSTRGGNVPYDVALGTPDEQIMPVSQAPQQIGPLDKLQITVFQVENLSGEFIVDSAGAISFPLIGSVPAQGKTALELAQSLQTRLGERYLKAPSVQVSILESNPQTITVDGSVTIPGVFPIKGPTTLMKAVAMARGVAPDANPSRIVVFRTVNGERLAGAFDLADIRHAKVPDPVIYGNDIIIVDGSRTRAIFRDLMQTIPFILRLPYELLRTLQV